MRILISENQVNLIVENKATIDNLVKIIKLTQSDAELIYDTDRKLYM